MVAAAFRRARKGIVHAERGAGPVLAQDVLDLDRLRRRGDRIGVELGEDEILLEDVIELALQAVQLLVAQPEPGQMRDVLDVGSR